LKTRAVNYYKSHCRETERKLIDFKHIITFFSKNQIILVDARRFYIFSGFHSYLLVLFLKNFQHSNIVLRKLAT